MSASAAAQLFRQHILQTVRPSNKNANCDPQPASRRPPLPALCPPPITGESRPSTHPPSSGHPATRPALLSPPPCAYYPPVPRRDRSAPSACPALPKNRPNPPQTRLKSFRHVCLRSLPHRRRLAPALRVFQTPCNRRRPALRQRRRRRHDCHVFHPARRHGQGEIAVWRHVARALLQPLDVVLTSARCASSSRAKASPAPRARPPPASRATSSPAAAFWTCTRACLRVSSARLCNVPPHRPA